MWTPSQFRHVKNTLNLYPKYVLYKNTCTGILQRTCIQILSEKII